MAIAPKHAPRPAPSDAPPIEHLGPRFWKLLKFGDPTRSDAHVVGTLVMNAARCEMAFEDLWRHLLNDDHAGGAAVRAGDISRRRVREWYTRDLENYEQPHDRQQARTIAAALRDWARSHTWPGRGNTLQRVYEAHLSVALRLGSLTYPAAVRHIADEADVSRSAAERATAKLHAMGLVRRVRRVQSAGPKTATRYHLERKPLREARQLQGQRNLPLGAVGPVVPLFAADDVPDITHPVFRPGGGLQHDVWRCTVDLIAPTVSFISDCLDRPVRTVRHQVARLVAVGLVRRFDDGTLEGVTRRERLDQVAVELGLIEGRRRQLERHSEERLQHAFSLEVLQARSAGKQPRYDGILDPETGEVRDYIAPRPKALTTVAAHPTISRIPSLTEVQHRAATLTDETPGPLVAVAQDSPLTGQAADHAVAALVSAGLTPARASELVRLRPAGVIAAFLD